MTLSKYALMQQASIGPFDTLSMYYILLVLRINKFRGDVRADRQTNGRD